MKNFSAVLKSLLFLLVALTGAQALAASSLPNASTLRVLLKQGVVNGFASRLDVAVVDHKVQFVRAKYRYAKQGGASVVLPSTLLGYLLDEDNQPVVLPANALIKQVVVDVLDTPAASGVAGYTAPLMAVGFNTPSDLLGYTAVASLTGRVAGVPVGTAATMVKGPTRATSQLQLSMKGGSVVSGNFNVLVEYYISQ